MGIKKRAETGKSRAVDDENFDPKAEGQSEKTDLASGARSAPRSFGGLSSAPSNEAPIKPPHQRPPADTNAELQWSNHPSTELLSFLDSPDSLIGKTLFDEYKVLDKIGEGEMAVVYRAKSESLQQIVAMKTVKAIDQETMKRFALEVKHHMRLTHRNIVQPIACRLTDDGQPYFIMEYIKGIDLAELLVCNGRIELASELTSIVAQVCDALDYAHRHKIIHRDLKPGNIMVEEIDGDLIAKVVDFGLVQVQGELQRITRQGQALGSPMYMSPEHCKGIDLSPASDVYSLGAIVYEMITGVPPYEAPTVLKLMNKHCDASVMPDPLAKHSPSLPELQLLEKLTFKALQPNVNQRYQNCSEFKEDLRKWWHAVNPEQSLENLTEKSRLLSRVDVMKISLEHGSPFADDDDQRKSIAGTVVLKQEKLKMETVSLLTQSNKYIARQTLPLRQTIGKHWLLLVIVGVLLLACVCMITLSVR
ncbi:MAG: serine/threonine protein kinase [Cyanobacteria bacterium]|nr:serine/threonine protein kinase [Cyanobacteriota bacterium]